MIEVLGICGVLHGQSIDDRDAECRQLVEVGGSEGASTESQRLTVQVSRLRGSNS
jgi:hypothetical protein